MEVSGDYMTEHQDTELLLYMWTTTASGQPDHPSPTHRHSHHIYKNVQDATMGYHCHRRHLDQLCQRPSSLLLP